MRAYFNALQSSIWDDFRSTNPCHKSGGDVLTHTRHIIGHVLRIKLKIVKCASLIQSTLHIIKEDDSTELLRICPLKTFFSSVLWARTIMNGFGRVPKAGLRVVQEEISVCCAFV